MYSAGAAIAAAVLLTAANYYAIARSRPLLRALAWDYRPTPMPVLLFSALGSSAAVCVVILHVPLLFLYVLLYVFTCAGLRLAAGSFSPQLRLCANLVCVHLGMVHLSSLAALSLWLGQNPLLVYENSLWGISSLFAALGIVFAVCAALQRFADMEHLRGLAGMTGTQRTTGWFCWFALGYIVFDSIPCMFDLPFALVSWFLLGSCLLLWAQLYFLLGYAYRIFVRQHLEHECRLLEQQQTEHFTRTSALRKDILRDALTGAYSREHIMRVLRRWLLKQKKLALAYIDLNGLKQINDTLGHDAGDAYLASAAAIMKRHLRAKGLLARIGGDEFLAIMPDADADDARALLKAAAHELENEDAGLPRSMSYGVEGIAAGSNLDAQEIICRADRAMYEDKKRKKLAAVTGRR